MTHNDIADAYDLLADAISLASPDNINAALTLRTTAANLRDDARRTELIAQDNATRVKWLAVADRQAAALEKIAEALSRPGRGESVLFGPRGTEIAVPNPKP